MRKYPDFKLIGNNFDKDIDLVLISHFHLDHCGALPYFTEILGFLFIFFKLMNEDIMVL